MTAALLDDLLDQEWHHPEGKLSRLIGGRPHVEYRGLWVPVPGGGSTVNASYGSETSLTWSGAIASSTTAGRESNAIDNTSTLADDYMVFVKVVYPNSAPANDKTLYFFAGGWAGATNTYQGRPQLTGSDAGYTFNDITTTPSGLQPCLASWMVQNTTGVFVIPSIATAFGGYVPPKFGLALANYSGQTITTFTATYRALTSTVA